MDKQTLKKAAFLTARTSLGFTHFALQSLADGAVELEATIVGKTGVWDKNGVHHQNISKDMYKASRREMTKVLQSKAIASLEESKAKALGILT